MKLICIQLVYMIQFANIIAAFYVLFIMIKPFFFYKSVILMFGLLRGFNEAIGIFFLDFQL